MLWNARTADHQQLVLKLLTDYVLLLLGQWSLKSAPEKHVLLHHSLTLLHSVRK